MNTQEKTKLENVLFQHFPTFEEKFKQFLLEQYLRTDWINVVKNLSTKLYVMNSEADDFNYLLTEKDKITPFILSNKELCYMDSDVNSLQDVEKIIKDDYTDRYVDTVCINEIKYSKSDFVGNYAIVFVIVCEKNCNESQKFLIKVLLSFLKKVVNDLTKLERGITLSFWHEQASKYNFDLKESYINEIFDTGLIPKAEIITNIAFLNYENRANKSTLIFMDVDSLEKISTDTGKLEFADSNKENWSFEDKTSQKTIRKMLETCGDKKKDGSYLIAQLKSPYYLLGLVTDVFFEKNILNAYKYWAIEFTGNGEWKLFAQDEILLVYSKGHFLIDLKQEKVQLEDLVKRIKHVEAKSRVFVNIIERLQRQAHGALMIIAQDAECEAKILCEKFKKGTLVEKLDFSQEENLKILDGIASVDGAVLVDFEGICYGFSVILDGAAKVKGDLGRGSRYNSSVNYIAGEERYAVIVSEDKENGVEIHYGKEQTVMCRTLD